jgi:hypothetical protein
MIDAPIKNTPTHIEKNVGRFMVVVDVEYAWKNYLSNL